MAVAKNRGYILIQAIVYASIGVLLIGALITWAGTNTRTAREGATREGAFQVAEAGIEYYRWHLAHSPLDFQDGTGGPGPYVHSYKNKLEETIGQFTLTITPPQVGSTLVTIRSKGELTGFPDLDRTIEVRLAVPSLAKYAVAANDDMRFGAGTEVFGPIHSNKGIRFDGLAHNIISSSLASYNDPDHSGGNEYGVHTHISPTDPLPPTAMPTRTDVFESGRQVSVPAIDFTGFTADLAQIKADAQAAGRYISASGSQGYNIVLKIDDSFDLYRVTSLVSPPSSGCTDYLSQSGWGTWSVNNQTFIANYPIPANGLIFVEDNTWVEGQINSARVTIASGRFPENPATNASITVNKDIFYTNYDGSDVIALISQNNINAGMVADTDLNIDAALVAKNGRVGRYYYRPNGNWPSGGGSSRCSPYHTRNSITLFGMIATNQRYGFAYTDNTGYITRDITYDGNLLYAPPPSFPLVGDQYQIISWTEVK
jgi:type II secretory pathway pseudopilin PulG